MESMNRGGLLSKGKDRLRFGLSRVVESAEERPATAWTLMLTVALLMAICSTWQIASDMWSRLNAAKTFHGGDPLGIQAVMAFADRAQIAGWLAGPSIDERTWRPLCTLFHWLEFQLWGTNELAYLKLSFVLHALNVPLISAVAARLAPGRLGLRIIIGLSAAIFLVSTPFADTTIQDWMLGYWPAQSDMISLTLSLLGFILLPSWLGSGSRIMLAATLMAFIASALFKEMAYAAIVGAMMFSVGNGERGRRTITALGAVLALLVIARCLALAGYGVYRPTTDLVRILRVLLPLDFVSGTEAGWPAWAAAFGLVAFVAMRTSNVLRRWSWLGAVASVFLAAQWLGGYFAMALISSDAAILLVFAFVCLRLWVRRPDIRAISAVWIVATWAIAPFQVALRWHFYWPDAFRCTLQAVLLPEVIGLFLVTAGFAKLRGEHASVIAPARHTVSGGRIRLRSWLMPCVAFVILAAMLLLAPWIKAIGYRNSVEQWTLAPSLGSPAWTARVSRRRAAANRDRIPVIFLTGPEFKREGNPSMERLQTGLARLGFLVFRLEGQPERSRAIAALHWIRSHAADLRANPNSIALMGWGDGARIALEVGYSGSNGESTEPPLQCVVAFAARDPDKLLQQDILAAHPPKALPPSGADRPDVSLPPNLFLACSREDLARAEPRFDEVKRRLVNAGRKAALYAPADSQGVFPLEKSYWKHSLDLALEFTAQSLNPPPVP